MLCVHSLLDGVAIGLAFQASRSVGIIVAIAVLTHDFSDGINTMNVVLKNQGDRPRALSWLLLDAVAPVVGIAATALFKLRIDGTVPLWLPLIGGYTALAGRVLVLGLAAMGLNLLLGFTGVLSFGHAAYFGLGAYGAGLTLRYLVHSTTLAMLAGTLLGGPRRDSRSAR